LDEFDKIMASESHNEKSITSGVVAAVFGSTGFTGQYVVQRLAEAGAQIIVPYRGTENVFRHLRPLGDIGQVVPIACDVWKPEQVDQIMEQSNVVINLIGKRWNTRNFTTDDVNRKIPEMLAASAQNAGVNRFIHVSSLEARPDSISVFGNSKYAGELAVREAFPEATIIRPATMFGFEDRFLNTWGTILKSWAFLPIVEGTLHRREGPVSVVDVAGAIQKCTFDHKTAGETYELEGPVITLEEVIDMVQKISYLNPRKVHVPLSVAVGISKVLELIRNPTYTADEWRALRRDNVASPNAKTFKDLNMVPIDVRNEAIRVLRYYRHASLVNEL